MSFRSILTRIRETSGPTLLRVGSIADGEYAKRVGSTLVGGVPAGGGFSYGFTAPPIASAWTQTNFNASDTLTDITPGEGNAVLLHTLPDGFANDLRVVTKAAPATPYTVTAYFRTSLDSDGGQRQFAGLIFRESATGKLYSLAVLVTIGGAPQMRVIKWTDPLTYSADVIAAQNLSLQGMPFYGLRIKDDGTNLLFSFSSNMGGSWIQVASTGRTAFMAGGPDHIGFHTDPSTVLFQQDMTLYSWAIT